MNIDALKKLTFARTQLILGNGFFGMLALRLKLVEDEGCKTLAVDGKHIFYNPDFVLSLSDSLCRSAMAHEVMHCVFDHMARRSQRNLKRWNHAGDYAINQVLEDSGFEIGSNWLLSANYKGMSADEIYNMLPDDPDGDSLDDVQCGDPSGMDSVEWKIATVQAATAAKAQGKLPGTLQRFLEELTKPQIDWRDQLRQFVNQISRDDFSWSRANRMFAAQGLFVPGLYSESMGEIAVAIDTSGSITNEILKTFGSEIKAIADTVRPSKIHVIYCDAAVNHVDEFSPNDVLEFKPHGGGGTDFNPPFDYLAEHNIKPQAFIYLTDMYGPFPPVAPDFPVMWCSTSEVIGPFGQTIQIEA